MTHERKTSNQFLNSHNKDYCKRYVNSGECHIEKWPGHISRQHRKKRKRRKYILQKENEATLMF